jgi:transcriptional regulator with XRE-family HTH domain
MATMTLYSANLRRLMARLNLTLHDVTEKSGLNVRTIKAILNGRNSKPHSRTLHRLAIGLGVETDEFFKGRTPAKFGDGSLIDRNRKVQAMVDGILGSLDAELFEGIVRAFHRRVRYARHRKARAQGDGVAKAPK